jgi:hypothetical protein
MNSIITHEFDFNAEEVLAYYISFLKSLSMKLTADTLLFFHNEHLPQVIISFLLRFRVAASVRVLLSLAVHVVCCR